MSVEYIFSIAGVFTVAHIEFQFIDVYCINLLLQTLEGLHLVGFWGPNNFSEGIGALGQPCLCIFGEV